MRKEQHLPVVLSPDEYRRMQEVRPEQAGVMIEAPRRQQYEDNPALDPSHLPWHPAYPGYVPMGQPAPVAPSAPGDALGAEAGDDRCSRRAPSARGRCGSLVQDLVIA